MYQLLVSKTLDGPETLSVKSRSQDVIEAYLASSTYAQRLRSEGYRYWRMASTHYQDRRAK